MDETKSTPVQEQSSAVTEVGADQALSANLEVQVAPVAAEAGQNAPKADDGAAVAQAQVASVATDDSGADPAGSTIDPTASVVTTPPLTAADVDVIEPEWVKKAEAAVAKHRDDPRAEEQAVEEVQIEYLKKRYNIDVKPGEDKP